MEPLSSEECPLSCRTDCIIGDTGCRENAQRPLERIVFACTLHTTVPGEHSANQTSGIRVCATPPAFPQRGTMHFRGFRIEKGQ